MSKSRFSRGARLAALAGGGAVVLSMGAIAPTAVFAAPAPAPANPSVVFEETFENGVGASVIGLTSYVGDQGATYTADSFWLNPAACNGLVLQGSADWSGAGAPCATPQSRDRLEDLAGVLGGGSATNHAVAAYTDLNGAADQTLLAKSANSGIDLVENRFYVASIDLAEVNCYAAAKSTISFGLQLPSGEIMIDGDPAVVCLQGQTTSVNGQDINYGTFFSEGFKSPESGSAEYLVRNLQTSGGGNDFAYDNLRFYDATPTLHKSFSSAQVEVGQPVTMELTVVNTTELSEKTGWSFTDTMPEGMTIASEPNASTTCAAADVTAEAGAGVLEVADGSLADGATSCTISVDVVLADGGEFTNVITDVNGLDGTPSDTVRALVPSMSLTKSVDPTTLTADNREAVYTFTVLNDGDVDLHDVQVSDPGPIGGKGEMGPIDCGGVTDLAVDEELTCTAVYTADLADITGADLKNEATATGLSPAGTPVDADAEATLPTVKPNPELTLVKSADTEVATKAGQVITYSFVVTNTGNVNVADVEVLEGEFSGAGELGEIVCPAEAELLVPTASITCEADYTVVATDLTGKPITNTATAAGTGPNGPVNSEVSEALVKTVAPAVVPAALTNTGGDVSPLIVSAALMLLLAGGVTLLAVKRRQMS